MKKTIYLAGPLTGLKFKDTEGWRKEVEDHFSDNPKITILSPLKEVAHFDPDEVIEAKGYEQVVSADAVIVEKDFLMIRESNVLLINFLQKEDSVGTLVEIGYAKGLNKMIICICKKDGRLVGHPFINRTCVIVHTLEDALSIINCF